MSRDDETRAGFSLRRWSARKHAAAREANSAPPLASEPPAPAAPARAAMPDTPPSSERAAPAPPLPPVESLTPESDFAPFMQGEVDETLKRAALKKLFSDPHFNVMDGLDVYIDDYSKPDPIAPDLVKQLAQSRYIFDPPPTRVNDQGFVEDTPKSELSAAAPGPAGAAAAESQRVPPAELPEPPKPPRQTEIPLAPAAERSESK
jgi:Protein of unknown function (DUF3306)